MNKQKLIAGSLACLLSIGALSGVTASAYGSDEGANVPYSISERAVARRMLSLSPITNKRVGAHAAYSVYVADSRLSVKGIRIAGVDYIPLRAAANAIGASYSYDSSTRTARLSLSGLTLFATDGNYAVMANDRPLFAMTPSVIMSDGRMYIPAATLAKALGLVYSSTSEIRLTGRVRPLLAASRYYREDEVFWLARIIHAESSGEPLIGKIAVGNVVLGRVRSSYYPNTIYGVIFDRKYGVQFSPVANGTIYNNPSYASVLAAKICLEGFDLAEGSLFFLRPELSSSSWIPDSREYVFTVGKHDFYK